MSTRTKTNSIADAAAAWVARRDAGMTPAQADELKRWLAADARHASAFEHYSGAWSVLDRAPTGRTADAVLQELRTRASRRRRRGLAVAAAVAVCALGGAFAWRTSLAPAVASKVAAGHSGVLLAPETRTLADGSIVELKRGAEISVEFTEKVRRVVLVRGEAHFQVAKNPAWPFAVDTGGVQVRAVGTAFSVQREAQQIDVLVTEGRIAVERPAPPSAEPVAAPAVETLATVGAGERITVPAEMDAASPLAAVAVSAEEAGERLAWRAPRVEFSETPLADAVAMMNRAARGATAPRLVIDPAARRLAREPVSGVFRADNTEAFVRVLELSLGVQTERRGDQLVMRRD